jgi:hypothetical protein
MLVSAKQRERLINSYGSMKKTSYNAQGSSQIPDMIEDHMPERVLDNVYRILKPSGNTLKGS